ncbi:MAG: hypothetical protein WCO77_06125 [bacterium]
MADRISPIRKTPSEILTDLMEGHKEALFSGTEKGKKYLLKFSERNTSLPNAVKFFLNDLLAEDAFQSDDLDTCRTALTRASEYLPVARTELLQRFSEYSASIRLYERGISLAIDDGELEKALSLCDEATALGFGKIYIAKRASIERMM